MHLISMKHYSALLVSCASDIESHGLACRQQARNVTPTSSVIWKQSIDMIV